MQLFISYSRKNTFLVETQIVELINTAGYEAWFDHKLIVGIPWKQQLIEKIKQCDAFVYAMTPASISSQYCQWEYKKAVEMDKPIIPILLENCELPDTLSEIQYVDFTNGATAKNFAKLMQGLMYHERRNESIPQSAKITTHVEKSQVKNIPETPDVSRFDGYRENVYEKVPIVFLATLGQRPEAITTALDLLLPKYDYSEVSLIHSHPELSEIADPFLKLMRVLESDYPDRLITTNEVTMNNGDPLIDVTDEQSGESYYRGILNILMDYRLKGRHIHLLISGGRKIMSIYATLAASIVFNNNDRVWTVIGSPSVMQAGVYHVPVERQHEMSLIALPALPSQSLSNMLPIFKTNTLVENINPRDRFIESLTEQEKLLSETLAQHPYFTNRQLAELIGKSERTIENQLRSIYQKLALVFDTEITKTRTMLLEVMHMGR